MRSLVLISVGLALSACEANNGDESFVVSRNVVPGANCTFTASANEQFLPHGELSLFARRGYILFPQVISNIIATDTQIQQRTIQLMGARVDLSFVDTSLDSIKANGVTRFESRFAAPLSPNGGITDTAFELIPTAVVDAIAAAKGITPASTESFRTEVIATATIFGQLSGNEVTSQAFEYPVTICNDCITHNLGACPLPAGTTVIAPTNPCNPFQDGVADCCSSGNTLVCPATVTPPMQ